MADTGTNADSDAMKALEEWCGDNDGTRSGVIDELRRAEERQRAAGCAGFAASVARGSALLAAAPALLERVREELTRVRADLDKAEIAGLTAAMCALREAQWNPSAAVGMVRLVSVDPLKTEPVVLRREQVVGIFEALERAAAPLLTGKFRTAHEAVRRYEEHDGLVAERDAALRELARVRERLEKAEGAPNGAHLGMR